MHFKVRQVGCPHPSLLLSARCLLLLRPSTC
jgi:hypothetical protein